MADDTPRCNAMESHPLDSFDYRAWIIFARQLERELSAANEKLAKARPSEEAVNVAHFIVSVSASRQANIAARELLRLDELAKPNRKE